MSEVCDMTHFAATVLVFNFWWGAVYHDREIGSVTVTIEMPSTITHVDCPPPEIPKQRFEERRSRALLELSKAR